MKTFPKLLLAAAAVLLLAGLIWVETDWTAEENAALTAAQPESVIKAEKPGLSDMHLRDRDALYERDDDTSVVTMYLTVSRGNTAENTDHSWAEINAYSVYDYEEMGVERYQIAGLLQVGDENGPLPGELGYGEKVPNATVQVRGQISSRNFQKNYKIEIKKGKGLWNDQRTIALNKHEGDGLRFRTKLAYDLLEEIPQLLSLRTQFVHLYVRDMTGENPDEFEDYGLYTQVEQLNGRAMRSHGLDENGQLYKINSFEFFRHEDVIRLTSDPLYDEKAFSERLEIKGSKDHSKLIRMLDAVNSMLVTPEDLLETYFDKENVAYWMAFQILMGNADTQNRNFYLYSPLNSEKWYLISWDHDEVLMRHEFALNEESDQGSWETGVSNYWCNVLFQRLLKSAVFREALDAAVEDLYAMLTEEKLSAMMESYAEVVLPYLYSYPDIAYADIDPEVYEMLLAESAGEVEVNYQLYLKSWESPMPFYIDVPDAQADGSVYFSWEAAYDFDGEDITYSFAVARDYQFQEVLCAREGLVLPWTEAVITEPGQYFVRVSARNASGYTQDAFDYYVTNDGKAYGMCCFYLLEDRIIEVEDYGL